MVSRTLTVCATVTTIPFQNFFVIKLCTHWTSHSLPLSPPQPPTPTPAPLFYFPSLNLSILGVSCMWDSTIIALLCLAYFPYHNVSQFIHACFYNLHFFLDLCNRAWIFSRALSVRNFFLNFMTTFSYIYFWKLSITIMKVRILQFILFDFY